MFVWFMSSFCLLLVGQDIRMGLLLRSSFVLFVTVRNRTRCKLGFQIDV